MRLQTVFWSMAFLWFDASGALAAEKPREPVLDALPMVGTGGHGHTYPGATRPFGFVQLSPDTRTSGWDGCSGYHESDAYILGFSHTHLSGTGIGDLGDVLLMPVVGNMAAPFSTERFKSGFSHQRERAEPGYYQVKLDRYDVTAELTATERAGMHRYTFPASPHAAVLIDLVHGVNNKAIEASLAVESPTLITGHRVTTGWNKKRTIYFALECSQPWKGFSLESDGKLLASGKASTTGSALRSRLDFETTEGQQILFRVGLSAVSVEGAKKNLRAEIADWDFDRVRAASRAEWDEALSRIQIASPDPVVRQTFYSALYHTMLAPTLYNDADKAYRGADGKVHTEGTYQYYSTFSLWDTYRAEHPLLTLVTPERVNDLVQSLVAFFQQGPNGTLPMWALASFDTGTMIGYHSLPVIADAYTKGFRAYDAEQAYQAMRATALAPGTARTRQGEYLKFGYVPRVEGKDAAAARTLEFAYDDWCVAQVAHALGKKEDYATFSQRAQNYRKIWDPKTRFFRGKNEDGTFSEGFNPKAVSSVGSPGRVDYREANAWQYTFSVPHDVPGMIELYGGREAFVARLDELFNQDSDMDFPLVDITGVIGQYAHGNEPCHHVPYLYALAGAQYKTALRVRQLLAMQYDNTPEGLCGNDDCGQISAWYVFSAMGLYPLNAADGRYVIGSPIVEKAVLKLDPTFYPGGTFTILAPGVSKQHVYVKSAKLNGRELDRPWVTHEEIAKGGTLEFEMSILPEKKFGAFSEVALKPASTSGAQ